MEDEAIREGFAHLRPGREYDGLHQAALCRSKADWLVGINATRLFSLLYGCTLNIGRVVSPTLALVVQREVEIAAFQPETFYTVELDCGASPWPGNESPARRRRRGRRPVPGQRRRSKPVERRENRKPPALFDLTTLQREANRTLGYTAQQTLDYLQALYDKKFSTYPRTDSRYLTDDMEAGVPALVEALPASAVWLRRRRCWPDRSATAPGSATTMPWCPRPARAGRTWRPCPLGSVRYCGWCLWACSGPSARPAALRRPASRRCVWGPYTAKWKEVLSPGWKVHAQTADAEVGTGPDRLTEGQTLPVAAAKIKTGKTTPPKHHTEDSLLSAMETAGKEDMPEDAERQGIGTPATRATILEKLVSAGFVERKKSKENSLSPAHAPGNGPHHGAAGAVTVPTLTAEWEHRLKEVERGTLAPETSWTRSPPCCGSWWRPAAR